MLAQQAKRNSLDRANAQIPLQLLDTLATNHEGFAVSVESASACSVPRYVDLYRVRGFIAFMLQVAYI